MSYMSACKSLDVTEGHSQGFTSDTMTTTKVQIEEVEKSGCLKRSMSRHMSCDCNSPVNLAKQFSSHFSCQKAKVAKQGKEGVLV